LQKSESDIIFEENDRNNLILSEPRAHHGRSKLHNFNKNHDHHHQRNFNHLNSHNVSSSPHAGKVGGVKFIHGQSAPSKSNLHSHKRNKSERISRLHDHHDRVSSPKVMELTGSQAQVSSRRRNVRVANTDDEDLISSGDELEGSGSYDEYDQLYVTDDKDKSSTTPSSTADAADPFERSKKP